MTVKREFLGETKQGAPIYGYHITNNNGTELCVINYGAAIRMVTEETLFSVMMMLPSTRKTAALWV